ncbi:MAG: hypothetical protein AMXMBFR84_30450 [Candidatus Hydrogenedentota bacterium]
MAQSLTRRILIRPCWLVYPALFLLVAGIYSQTIHFEFLNYDDNLYVTQNDHVQRGLSVANILWALQEQGPGSWHPLTLISHMTDVSLFGMKPGAHHAVNVFFHGLNAALLLFALHRLTGDFWPSAATAALFAAHPLRVESVAWIAERKDVLSAFFWILGLIAYASYARKPGLLRYTAVLGAFVLGLMAKPMVVTFPCVLLLLDVWPLRRIPCEERPNYKQATRLVLEKLPLFACAAAVALLTVAVQADEKAVSSLDKLALSIRVNNALVSYVDYARLSVWPSGLCGFYPHPLDSLSGSRIAVAVAILVAVSLATMALVRKAPYWFTGWFWFLGTLVPVIGIVQVGTQAMADRYSYIPQIGLIVAVCWTLHALTNAKPWRIAVAALAVIAAVSALSIAAHRQTVHWRNSEALFSRALAVTENNALAHFGIAQVHYDRGNDETAVNHLRQTLAIDPTWAEAYTQLGIIAERYGNTDTAKANYETALQLDPDEVRALINLGVLLLREGNTQRAYSLLYRAYEIAPGNPEISLNISGVLLVEKRFEEALAYLDAATRRWPDHANLHVNRGVALRQLGQAAAAQAAFDQALALDPDNADAKRNLGLAE